MIDRGYDVAVVWSRSGGTYDRCGDVLYLSNYVSTESGQNQLTAARRNYLGARCVPFAATHDTLFSDSYIGESERSELIFQGHEMPIRDAYPGRISAQPFRIVICESD